ncbi:CFI-box-CTERM domain-containing protein [Mycetocola zhadangensis]|uniref:CFI-box-CTERM domain-containing protein n=1 Tax=Mycetocola zhadangensis TaxID=1164595 RepID=UPI0011C49180|nr:CFI-box-CTERM domain-containing protein [Mycetocola zhadangensis]GGE89024.1 hypothetical protein GCM10011313_09640 [Mycetocola zhadangensis]
MGTDNGTWLALFAILREESPETFASWVNYHHEDFWLDQDIGQVAAWAYENADGVIVERFPGLNEALLRAATEARRQATERNTSQTSGNEAKGGCYIATAVYGSYDADPVLTLRRFRDERLSLSAAGRGFIHWYYVISPVLVRRFGHVDALHRSAKFLLDRIVRRLES